ncbi:MAG: sugar transferase [Acidobacteriota bacterium]
MDPAFEPALTPVQRWGKRGFDLAVATGGALALSWLIALAWLAATLDTRQNGFFTQRRVGRRGRLFKVIKIRTMRPDQRTTTTVTTGLDPRITPLGRLFRRTKIDELPQLFNIIAGQMSFVGPRPDVPGFADRLEGSDRRLLALRPGITGPATLAFRDEETLLAEQADPERYNREVIWPRKVKLNLEYIDSYRWSKDLGYILQTVLGR